MLRTTIALTLASLLAPSVQAQGLPHVVRVDKADDVTPSDAFSAALALSSNGEWLLYRTNASNLVPEPSALGLLLLEDLREGTRIAVNVTSEGTALGFDADQVDISANGRFVAFTRVQPALDLSEIYLFDRTTGELTSITAPATSFPPDQRASAPTMSDDGRWLAWEFEDQLGPGSKQVALLDRQTDELTVFESALIGGQFDSPLLSNDGSTLLLRETALLGAPKWYRYDVQQGVGTGIEGFSFNSASLSFDGDRIAFSGSVAGNSEQGLFVHDFGSSEFDLITPIFVAGEYGIGRFELSGDGRYLAYNQSDDDFASDTFVRARLVDLVQGVTTLLGVNDSAIEAATPLAKDATSLASSQALAYEGDLVALTSNAVNLALPMVDLGLLASKSGVYVRQLAGGGADLALASTVAGAPTSLTVSGASPGAVVFVGLSATGQGPTATPFGLVDLSGPWQVVAVTTDANGEGAVGFTIPATLAGVDVFAQGLDFAALRRTTVLQATLE